MYAIEEEIKACWKQEFSPAIRKQQSRGKQQWLDVVKLTGAEAFMERRDPAASRR
jgi:hypothetical protein